MGETFAQFAHSRFAHFVVKQQSKLSSRGAAFEREMALNCASLSCKTVFDKKQR